MRLWVLFEIKKRISLKRMTTPLPMIPDKTELEKHLGESFRLDGSFASLWAVEVILNILRKKPEWQTLCNWIPQYVLSVLERSFREMGHDVTTDEKGTLSIDSGRYIQNVFSDIAMLINPPLPFPTISGQNWSSTPVLRLAALPWYSLAVIFQSQEWSPTKLAALAERQEDQLKAVSWLSQEYFVSELSQSEELKSVAFKILKATFTTPIYLEQNRSLELLLPQLQSIFTREVLPDNFVNALLRLTISQDLFVSVVAGACCFLINIAPTSPQEARSVKRCADYFKNLPQSIGGESNERVLEVVKMLSANLETPLTGMENSVYLESIRLANEQKYDLACERLTSLINQVPDKALYWRTRGKILEKLGREQYAIDDYNQAITLKPDYWQALINRANLSVKQKKYENARCDFLLASSIRPDCEITRDNLLTCYFLEKSLRNGTPML